MNQSFTLEELAAFTNSTLVGNPHHIIQGIADLESATDGDVSFLANPRYENAMQRSSAGAIFVSHSTPLISKQNFLVNENPSQAFQKALEAFFGTVQECSNFEGIHPTAVIHPSATIGKGATISPYAVIEKDVVIGEGSFIGSHCYIGPLSKIGTHCLVHPNVTIREKSQLGNRVILQPGVVIGSCGFGYTTDKLGKHTKLNQVGYVILEDDVEIGANTTIDRARFKVTRICRGTKIDNLVQIGHGVVVGEDNIIVAQTGIAGSSHTGKHVIIGGQVAVAGHISLADGVMVAGKSGISKSLTKAGKYNGIPAMPLAEYNRNTVHSRNIDRYVEEIKSLKERLEKLESNSKS